MMSLNAVYGGTSLGFRSERLFFKLSSSLLVPLSQEFQHIQRQIIVCVWMVTGRLGILCRPVVWSPHVNRWTLTVVHGSLRTAWPSSVPGESFTNTLFYGSLETGIGNLCESRSATFAVFSLAFWCELSEREKHEMVIKPCIISLNIVAWDLHPWLLFIFKWLSARVEALRYCNRLTVKSWRTLRDFLCVVSPVRQCLYVSFQLQAKGRQRTGRRGWPTFTFSQRCGSQMAHAALYKHFNLLLLNVYVSLLMASHWMPEGPFAAGPWFGEFFMRCGDVRSLYFTASRSRHFQMLLQKNNEFKKLYVSTWKK